MITEAELDALIGQGREQRAVEFKGAGRRDDKHFLARVARACIAISNLRDGGWVVIGVEDAAPLNPVGLDADALTTWQSFDDVASSLARYCDPPVSFDLGVLDVRGVKLVVLEVSEFSSIPTLAGKDYQDVLARGLIYVRGMARIESTGHPTGHDLREVLDLAVEKGVRRFVEVAQRSGLWSGGATPPPSEGELFEAQLGELA